MTQWWDWDHSRNEASKHFFPFIPKWETMTQGMKDYWTLKYLKYLDTVARDNHEN